MCWFLSLTTRTTRPPKTEMIQNRKTSLSQGKMIILLQLNDIDIPPRGCAEWAELRWSGGSCYGLSLMQINMGSSHFLFDQQRKHGQISLSSRRTFYSRAQRTQSAEPTSAAMATQAAKVTFKLSNWGWKRLKIIFQLWFLSKCRCGDTHQLPSWLLWASGRQPRDQNQPPQSLCLAFQSGHKPIIKYAQIWIFELYCAEWLK